MLPKVVRFTQMEMLPRGTVTADDKMSSQERNQYLQRIQKRYRGATRKEKKALLDEVEAHTGMHRKSIIRRLKGSLERRPRKWKRGPEYGAEFDSTLQVLAESTDYVCAERLTPNLLTTAELLATHHEVTLTPTLAAQLATVSISTVRRHLPETPEPQRRRKPQPPQNRYQQQLPTRRIPRDTAMPGHFEVDLVHHCGRSTEGEYVYTLHIIDVATGWSGRRAILGRSYVAVADALEALFAQLPFPVLELHVDNGSEFLNAHLLSFLEREHPQVKLSRSRPATPNDNRLVEQKNHTLVRDFLGDRRFDTVTQTRYLNTLYAQLGVFYNFFQPVMRQIGKHWVPATDKRAGYLKRTHDTPRPPVERLCEAPCLALHQQRALWAYQAARNPLQLRRKLYRDREHLFDYPTAQPGVTEDVYQTLAYPERFPLPPTTLPAVDTVDKPHTGLPTVPTAATTADSQLTEREETAALE